MIRVTKQAAQLSILRSDLINRLHCLEEALAICQRSVSDKPHPLLSEELVDSKYDDVLVKIPTELRATSFQAPGRIGTLAIDDEGNSKYFGRSAGTLVSQNRSASTPLIRIVY